VGTFGLTLLSIAGLFVVDTFLVKIDRTESSVEAIRLFKQGQALLSRGENTQAIEQINDALEIQRDNRDFLRTLAQAQLGAGRTSDAETTLASLLETDSGDGEASLLMARVLTKEGRFPEASSFFHRAVYGHWDKDEQANRERARSELIDLLAQRNSKEDLLAELLAVQDRAPQDLHVRMRLGLLFLQAGSPARAGDVFHAILHDDPTNAGAYKGLGEAGFARGDYRGAERDFQAALRLAPNDASARHRLEVCTELLQLDPMLRGLTAEARFRRSLQLVQLTLNEINACGVRDSSADLKQLLDRANSSLTAKVAAARLSEVAEANLDIAEQVWLARKKECRTPPDPNGPLALVLARLTQ
jgi:Flp pilus assembly protein TadD